MEEVEAIKLYKPTHFLHATKTPLKVKGLPSNQTHYAWFPRPSKIPSPCPVWPPAMHTVPYIGTCSQRKVNSAEMESMEKGTPRWALKGN